MNNENSKILKNSLILYFRLILISIIGLISSRILLQAIGVSNYGIYTVVGGIVTIMNFLNIVMTSTTYRFIAFELGKGENQSISKIFNISMAIHMVIVLIIIILSLTIGLYYIKNILNIPLNKTKDALFVFLFSIIGTSFTVLAIPFKGLLTAMEKFSITAPIEVIKNIVILLMILIVGQYSGNKLRLYSVFVAIASFIPLAFYYFYCNLHFSSIVKWAFQKDRKMYKEMISFSSWILLGATAIIGESQGAALLINFFFGTVLNASYGIANQVNSVIKMFSQSLNQAVVPQITKSYSSGSTDRTLQLAMFTSKYSFFLMLIPSLPILLETKYILSVWLVEVPGYTSIFVQIMIINALISTLSAGIYPTIHATGKIKHFQIALTIITLSGLPLSFVGYKFGFPPYSILIVFTLTSLLYFIIQNLMLKKLLNFEVELFLRKPIFRIILILISIIPLFLIRDCFVPNLIRFVTITAFSIIWLFSMIYFIGMEKYEKKRVLRLIKEHTLLKP